jgi:peroxiredoxin
VSQATTVPDVGTVMPDLALADRGGARTTLDDVREGRSAIVYFLRAASCPVCVRHARELASLADKGRLGDRAVVLVVPGGPDDAARLAGRVTSPQVTCWASGEGHAAAGLGSFMALQHSGTFVLSPTGAVVYRRTSLLPTGSFSAGDLLDALPA